MVTERATGQRAGGFETLNRGSVLQPVSAGGPEIPLPHRPLHHQSHSHLIYTHTFTMATINYLWNIPTGF